MTDRYTQPKAGTAALLTIDLQNDFSLPDGSAYVQGTEAILEQASKCVHAFRAAGRPIVHVVRIYLPDGTNADACRRSVIESGASIVRPGSPGARLVAKLTPDGAPAADTAQLLNGDPQAVGPGEWLLYKPRWSAFFRTGLDTLLRGMGIDTVVVIGCNYPNCPRSTIYDASNRDYRICAVTDALSGLYDKGLDEMAGIGVQPMTAGEMCAWLASAKPAHA